MIRMKSVICWLVLQCCLLTVFAADKDMDVVKRNICESYLRILNDAPVLQEKIGEISQRLDNPDIMIRELREGVKLKLVGDWFASIQNDGSWGDLDYKDESRSGWQPSIHSERLMMMAKAYQAPGGVYFQKKELGKAIHRGMDFWFTGNFRCRNWWYNQIGVPKMMGCVFLLMESEMDGQEKAAAIKYMENARLGMTGQNSVWLAENVLTRALLLGDEALFVEARNAILKELRVNEQGEGIRPDWSFHQHGPLLQFGNYGLAYANTMAYWARMFQGTRFALGEEQLKVLRNYFLEGMQWIVWKGNMDISSCARQVFRYSQEGKALSFGKAVRNMQVADKRYAAEYKQFYKTHVLNDGSSNVVTGNRYFRFSDFGVHRERDWYATLKMSSSRVIGSEVVNSENLSGYYMGDGALLVYRRGDEFRDIFPVWDWTKIPGVTCYDDPQVFEKNKAYTYRNAGDFAGGVSDGKTGLVAMILDKNGLTGNKSYFFTGDAIVCLGSRIRGDRDCPVNTTVAQCLKKGEVHSATIGDGMAAYWHDGIAYAFPKGMQVDMTAGKQSGAWNKVAVFYDSMKEEKEVFRLSVRHGAAPTDGSYCYTIRPNVSEKNWQKEMEKATVKVLAQEKEVHALAGRDGWQIVFFEPGSVELASGLSLTTGQACLVMVKPEKGGYRFQVVDPTWKQKDVVLRLPGKWNGDGCRYDQAQATTVVTVSVENRRGADVSFLIIADKGK